MTARILKLRHPNGSLINSLFLSWRWGINPCIQTTHTKICMTDPLLTKLEVWHALQCLNHHKDVCISRLSPKAINASIPYITHVLARILNLSFQTAQTPEDRRRTIITPVAQNPAQQTQSNSVPSVSRLLFAKSLRLNPNESMVMACILYKKTANSVWANQLTRLPCVMLCVKFQLV